MTEKFMLSEDVEFTIFDDGNALIINKDRPYDDCISLSYAELRLLHNALDSVKKTREMVKKPSQDKYSVAFYIASSFDRILDNLAMVKEPTMEDLVKALLAETKVLHR